MRTSTIIAACLIALGVLGYFSHQDMLLVGDGRSRYDSLAAFMEHVRQLGTPFSMVLPFCASPLYLVGKLLGNPSRAVSFFSLLVTLFFLPLFWRSLRKLTDFETATLSLILLLGNSMLLAYTPYFEPEPFSVALLGLAILWRHEGRPILAALALLVSTANLPASLVGAGLVSLRWAWQRGRWRWLCLPLLAGLEFAVERWCFGNGTSALGLNAATHPSPFPFSAILDFGYPWLLGVLNILFSFGKGLLFFCPGLLLWWSVRGRLRIQERHLLEDMLAYLLGLVLVYSHFTGWAGDDFWGPRFMLFGSLPASVLLAIALRERDASLGGLWLTLMVLAASAWVGIDGLVANLNGQQSLFLGDRQIPYFATTSTPEFSPLFRPIWTGTSFGSTTAMLVFWCLVAANLSLAYPLVKQLVDRALEYGFPDVKWRF